MELLSVPTEIQTQVTGPDFLPRRESGATVITIEETLDGKIDLQDLESKLILEHQKQLKSKAKISLIGCFTAASNVTGQVDQLLIDNLDKNLITRSKFFIQLCILLRRLYKNSKILAIFKP